MDTPLASNCTVSFTVANNELRLVHRSDGNSGINLSWRGVRENLLISPDRWGHWVWRYLIALSHIHVIYVHSDMLLSGNAGGM